MLKAEGLLACLDGLLTTEAGASFADEKCKDAFAVIIRIEGFVGQRKLIDQFLV